jgi:3-methylcrotonyl-CoA carboxylase alpha subunit
VPDDPWSTFSGYAHFHRLARQVTLFHGDGEIAATAAVRPDGRIDVSLPGGTALTLDPAQPTRAALWPGHVTIFEGAQSHNFAIPDPFARSEEAASKADTLRAPMPGLVKIVRAATGDAVTRGQPLLVLEAMKMEHSIAAPRDGVLAEIVAEGTQVTDGMVLVRFETADEAKAKSA